MSCLWSTLGYQISVPPSYFPPSGYHHSLKDVRARTHVLKWGPIIGNSPLKLFTCGCVGVVLIFPTIFENSSFMYLFDGVKVASFAKAKCMMKEGWIMSLLSPFSLSRVYRDVPRNHGMVVFVIAEHGICWKRMPCNIVDRNQTT